MKPNTSRCETAGPLETALAASKPIPTNRELLEVERLAATELDDLLDELRTVERNRDQ